jgi:hypothetical protein
MIAHRHLRARHGGDASLKGILHFPLLREQWRDRNLMGIASAPPIYELEPHHLRT